MTAPPSLALRLQGMAADQRPPEGSFEDLLGKLEEIVHRVESGEVGLEQSIAEYERGVALIRRCRDILTKAEQKVDELSRTLAEPAGTDPVALTPPQAGSSKPR